MNQSVEEILKEKFLNKILIKTEFENFYFYDKIIDLYVGLEETREDAVLYLKLENHGYIKVFTNEKIEIKEI